MTDPTRRVRALCLALPEVTERLSHGEASWFCRKQFVMMADHHHDDRLAFWAAAPEGAQDEWVALDAERFFVPPYVGGRGWVGVRLDLSLAPGAQQAHWDDVAEIIEDAWRQVAPAKLRDHPGPSDSQ